MSIETNPITEKITVLVNGEPFICISGISLASLLNYLDFDFRHIVVEYNSEIIKRDKLSSVYIKQNDVVEIVTIVGGG
uniref:Thiamine biosynthesis protein n=1 Tax=Bangiopsis subsimplex TaxID=139980 RepID=A0A1C9CCP7_9RHOD|nr:hypothetical protein Bangp_063 [Bangiopsis subsimplex]AOM66145.1 hypothetical protein Bangp_063 [Bangiopsis subsimplex]ARO90495.1 thiamine biosynthesis protein [Bangiopsis subsimplex]